MDQIRINGLEVYANHGVFEEEKKLGQKFIVNCVLYLDSRQAGLSDELEKSIHYGEVCSEITKFMAKNTYSLIEAVAEYVAADLFMKFDLIREMDLEIVKPWAPIGLPVQSVSVAIHRGWTKVYLSFGSNMGDRLRHIRSGIEALGKVGGCRVLKISDYLVTKAYGYTEQDDFLNGCLEMETLLEPEELLFVLNQIEEGEDRERLIHWGPRTLDLDILFYGNQIIETDKLVIPHGDLRNRKFVLTPMVQIAPYFRHPVLGMTMKELLDQLDK
ncbi:MAG: 2-amino-4-hydroxy-6-hydroxymethyldihydropteridine diphosphokinase [Lachnospiraceae bacterium]|jgi:dihydroneopterin aldolase / 2-amino-4-hydroxy-6-hydroxymethyldihydropteridine diphosphokinase|nr:2-amino-4-hydroxy-6-hydroxymethyldihydropteridine diphosphokinase [Lachnospiraceae bacterium]